MAEDAKVSQISELIAYAGKMQGFVESVSKNCTVLSNLMIEKLGELRRKLKHAEEMETEAIKEYNGLLSEMSFTPSNDVEARRALLAKKPYMERRKLKAQEMCGRVKMKVVVAQAMVRIIDDATKSFQKKTQTHVESGQKLIKKSVNQLEQYNETRKKL